MAGGETVVGGETVTGAPPPSPDVVIVGPPAVPVRFRRRGRPRGRRQIVRRRGFRSRKSVDRDQLGEFLRCVISVDDRVIADQSSLSGRTNRFAHPHILVRPLRIAPVLRLAGQPRAVEHRDAVALLADQPDVVVKQPAAAGVGLVVGEHRAVAEPDRDRESVIEQRVELDQLDKSGVVGQHAPHTVDVARVARGNGAIPGFCSKTPSFLRSGHTLNDRHGASGSSSSA